MKIALSLLTCVAVVGWGLHVQADDEQPSKPVGVKPVSVKQDSRLVTMYVRDPLSHSISLATGEPGSVLMSDGVFNQQSDIDYGHYNKEALSAGIEGGREGVIIDLGSTEDLATVGGYEETVGQGQGFASLRLEGKQLLNRAGRALDVDHLFNRKDRKQSTARPVPGHIYIVRIYEPSEPAFERIAKVLVIAHNPGVSVTIRWTLLRDEKGR